MTHPWKSAFTGATLALLAILAVGAATNTPSGGNAGRIAYVDVSAVVAQSQFTQAFKASLATELNSRVEPLLAKQQELEGLQEKIDKQRGVLSEPEIDAMIQSKIALMAEMEKEQYGIVEYRKSADRELATAYVRIMKAVEEVARAEGFAVVMRRENLIYGDPAVDLTEKVVAALDALTSAPAPLPAIDAQ